MDESKKRHSETPWHIETVRTSVGVCHKIGPLGSSSKTRSACLYDDSYSDKPRDLVLLADAEFIVRAVNAHEALLTALKEMAEWYGATHDDGCSCDDTCNCSRKPFNDQVNAAINLGGQ